MLRTTVLSAAYSCSVKSADMEELNYFTLNEELNNSLTELEKLHLANKFANQILERKENGLFNPGVKAAEENPVDSPESNFNDFPQDMWGASQYLGTNKFDYVKDYLHRTKKLLNRNAQIKPVSSATSYEVVESTMDLLIDVKSDSVSSQQNVIGSSVHHDEHKTNTESSNNLKQTTLHEFNVLGADNTEVTSIKPTEITKNVRFVDHTSESSDLFEDNENEELVDDLLDISSFGSGSTESQSSIRKLESSSQKVESSNPDEFSPTEKSTHAIAQVKNCLLTEEPDDSGLAASNFSKILCNVEETDIPEDCGKPDLLHTHRPPSDGATDKLEIYSNPVINGEYVKAVPVSCWFNSEQSSSHSHPNFAFHDCEQCRHHPHSNYLNSTDIIPPFGFSDVGLDTLQSTPDKDSTSKSQEAGTSDCDETSNSGGEMLSLPTPPGQSASLPTKSSSPLLSLLMQSNTTINGSQDLIDSQEDTASTHTFVQKSSLTIDHRNENISIPKLNFDEINQETVKPTKSPKKAATRPQSAENPKTIKKSTAQLSKTMKNNKNLTDSEIQTVSPKKQRNRPKSAGQHQSVSPQRVWEKSSIAWDSYGSRQLNTWSSVNMEKNFISMEKSLQSTLTKTLPGQVVKSPRIWIEQNLPVLKRCHHLTEFPDEIILTVFSYLSLTELLTVAKVCSRFHSLANDFTLWQNVTSNDIKITDAWLTVMGERHPKSIKISNSCGKSVTNKGLRNFFRSSKLHLQCLHVSKCTGSQLSGDSVLLHAACHCRALTQIEVPWSSTTDNGLSAICTSTQTITSVNVNGNSAITDESFATLCKRHGKTLKCLEMSGCFSVSNSMISDVITAASDLQRLNIGLCSKVNAEWFLTICNKLKHLLHLDLHGIKSINNECLLSIVTSCRHLSTLIVANCPLVTDVGLEHIAKHTQNITHLNIAGCPKVSDNGIADFVIVSKMLQHLDVSSTAASKLTVDIVSNYVFSSIDTLKLSFCKNITQSCLLSLLGTCSSLRSLHIYGCKRINLKILMNANKNVVIEK